MPNENLNSCLFLFGLAPGGVYPATPVTSRAVRSYRTFSPLLYLQKIKRYILCGTFPKVCLNKPRRTLSGTLSAWSPDFPPAFMIKTPSIFKILFGIHIINTSDRPIS